MIDTSLRFIVVGPYYMVTRSRKVVIYDTRKEAEHAEGDEMEEGEKIVRAKVTIKTVD